MNDLQKEFNDIYNKFYYHGQVFLPIKLYYKNKEYKALIDFWSFRDLKDTKIFELYDEKNDFMRSFRDFDYSIDFKFYKLFMVYGSSMARDFFPNGYYIYKGVFNDPEYSESETEFFVNYLKDVDINDYNYRIVRRDLYDLYDFEDL